MQNLLVKNANIIYKNEIHENYSVFCSNGTIAKIMPSSSEDVQADVVVDAKNMILAPGFIDLHMHGGLGLPADAGNDKLEKLTGLLPQYGVVGFLAGVCPTMNASDDITLLENLSKSKSNGSHVLGFFLEGHYLALTGAFEELPKDRSREQVQKLLEAAHPYKIVFGISPEVEGILDLLPDMTKQGYPAFITHTCADVTQTQAAIKAGAVHATHFYDVFPYPGEQEPGVRGCGTVEAILANPDATVDFILDGEHVNPIAVKMALACKGNDNVCLITDANSIAGLPPGVYTNLGIGRGDVTIAYQGAPARLSEDNGLAGSGVTMDLAVRNAVKLLDVDIVQAIRMASYNPAKVLGLHDKKGKIEEGYDANMVLLDNDLNVVHCWIDGKSAYSHNDDQ